MLCAMALLGVVLLIGFFLLRYWVFWFLSPLIHILSLKMEATTSERVGVSNELRERLIDMVFGKGKGVREAANCLNIKRRTAYNILRVFSNENRMEKKRNKGRNLQFNMRFAKLIGRFFERKTDATLREAQQFVRENPALFGARVPSFTTINRILKKLNITTKRLVPVPAARNSPRAIEQRRRYVEKLNELDGTEQLIYIDETGQNLHVRRGIGRSYIGTPATITTPTQRGNNLSICAALSLEGIVYYRTKYLAFNNVEFVKFLDELSAKFIADRKYVLIMDNAAFHHHQNVVNWFTERSPRIALIYLPFLNPIEECFSKVHQHVCMARSRSGEELFAAVSGAMDSITAENAQGWFRHTRKYHTKCLAREPILKEADEECPPFRILPDTNERESDESENEVESEREGDENDIDEILNL